MIKRLIKNKEFEKNALWLSVAMMIGNIANYTFQIVISRFLDVDSYGIVNALFAFSTIMTIPIPVLLSVVARYIAQANVTKQSIENYFIFFSRLHIYAVCVILFVLIVAMPFIGKYLKIDNYIYLVLIISAIGINYLNPIFYGYIQGMKDFTRLGVLYLAPSVSKLLIGFILVLFGLGIYGVLGAVLISSVFCIIIGLYFTGKYFSFQKIDFKGIDKYIIMKYILSSCVISVAVGIFTSSDILLVKYYFSAYDAGLYSAASIIGKMLLYIPTIVTTVIFPMAVEAIALKQAIVKLFLKAIFYAACLMGIVMVALNMYPELIITLLFGAKYIEAVQYMFYISLMTGALGFLGVVVAFTLAGNNNRLLVLSVIIGIVVYGVLIFFFHSTINQIIIINTMIVTGLLIINILCLVFSVFMIPKVYDK